MLKGRRVSGGEKRLLPEHIHHTQRPRWSQGISDFDSEVLCEPRRHRLSQLTSAAVIQGAGKHQVSLRQGATAGATPEEAFFVRCDAETNAVVDALSECEIKDGV